MGMTPADYLLPGRIKPRKVGYTWARSINETKYIESDILIRTTTQMKLIHGIAVVIFSTFKGMNYIGPITISALRDLIFPHHPTTQDLISTSKNHFGIY